MRAIDADRFECVMLQDCTDEFAEGAEYILEKIDEAPTLDVEPIRYGHWIPSSGSNPYACYYRCSNCGKTIVVLNPNRLMFEYPYCNCGAKMRKEDM